MTQAENFLHTTHRTITWFNKAFTNDDLVLKAPFQRNAVWTALQQSYLIDTVLLGLPIPEIYMQDVGDEKGNEKHIVVDGQQRIRAVLEFIQGYLVLDGDDVTRSWRGASFDFLTPEQKKNVFSYKFVVRVLPPELDDEGIRNIFKRLNKNVVALNDQELRNATYWGKFISAIQYIADDDPFWACSGLFSANDHRRMIDHEYISELVIAYLHGPQNKKDKLDHFYQLYEENFDGREEIISKFRSVSGEISQVLPLLGNTRWRKKSDFYTMFLEFGKRAERFPLPENERADLSRRLKDFGAKVDALLRIEEEDWSVQDPTVVSYARNVARAASDRNSRVARDDAFSSAIFVDSDARSIIGKEDAGAN